MYVDEWTQQKVPKGLYTCATDSRTAVHDPRLPVRDRAHVCEHVRDGAVVVGDAVIWPCVVPTMSNQVTNSTVSSQVKSMW